MLFNFEKSTRFYVYGTGVDMRKGIHSKLPPTSGDNMLREILPDKWANL